MTKEELIALSDLNREDNIKYISSEAQGIAIALDSDRYAPTLCKLERAYICGRRKSEEQIAELEKENAELKEQCSILADCNTCTSACKTENIEMKNNLIKAKEIIREFVEWATWQGSNCPNFKSIQDKAEQFISEVEK